MIVQKKSSKISRFTHPFWIFLCLHLFMQTVATETLANEPSTGIAAEISAIIASKQHPYLTQSNFSYRTDDLETLYKMTGYQLLWLDHASAEKNIVEALNLFETAAVNGLNPANYDPEILQQKLQTALKLDDTDYKQLALFDTALSISLLRYLHDLHYGRINPQGINFNLKLRAKKLTDLPALVNEHVSKGTVLQLPSLVEPRLAQYQKLKQALAHYRRLAAEAQPTELTVNKSIHPGDNFPQIENFRRFLVFLGDLSDDKAKPDNKKSSPYKGEIVEAVKRFQRRHGLVNDGILGKGTAEAMKVPLTQRVTQIELAMERLRWLPELGSGQSIIVNIPAFQLWAFNDMGDTHKGLVNMKVVVGKALKNQTPVLMATLSFIDFMPYWNIPYSITKEEILPKWQADPMYLDNEEMELVTRFGNEVKPVAFTKSSMEYVKQGSLKIRQRPGKKNPLGQVKFIFPNKDDVYLHGTPANALFSKSRRDFSHGCVRVENPELLAEFALKNQEEWTKETIKLAMTSDKTERIKLKKPIPVLFFYITSFFDQNDQLVFYPDIYGHDAVLMGALQKSEEFPDSLLFVKEQTATKQAVTH
ncbi:MAG: L,D-transpeptidase family protein [Methylococcaceae bacterium]|nr:L,D-transpeptidase family protein [Methylococcaceae bacterium]